MQTPTRFEAPLTSLRKSKRLLQITQSIPGIFGLVTTYESAVTSFEGRYNDWDQARRQASIALAVQHEAEAALGEEVRGVGLAILKVSRGRRNSMVYRDYFPQGYGEILKLSAERALQVSAGLLAAMSDETNPEILPRREPLSAARAQLESAYTARRAAAEVRSQAKAVLEEAKSVWRNAHSDFYFAVRSYFPDRRKWVESLFKVNGRRHSEEVPPGPADEVVTEGKDKAPPDSTGTLPKPSTSAPTITLLPSSAATTTATPEPAVPEPLTAEGGAAAA